jgi:FG-GAP-like repeat
MARRSLAIQCTLVLALVMFFYSACETSAHKEERIARQYCSACHVFPDPSLLDRATWEESILPVMAFHMGSSDTKILSTLRPQDIEIVLGAIPSQPMASDEDWEWIRQYYHDKAPDTVGITTQPIKDTLTLFKLHPLENFIEPYVSLLRYDSGRHYLYAGTRLSNLFTLDSALHKIDSIKLESPPSWIVPNGDDILVTAMGIMDPNDQPAGKLTEITKEKKLVTEIDSLKRPVFFEKADLNNDDRDDYVICAFGNYTGFLAAYESTGDGWITHWLSRTPGARKTIVRDFDNDGRPDIMALFAQGDERIVLYSNKGDFHFEQNTLLRFPPVYGTSYFEADDFNGDGYLDFLVTNGDNADYSMIVKPYHALTIFENDGANHFTEKWSFPMPGASMAMARDFDQDGDLDIAAISFFPDFARTPERSFLYFENKGNYTFTPRTTSVATRARWLVMETADYDQDGDIDIILGANNFRGLGSTPGQYQRWVKHNTALMVLKNRLLSR